MWTVPNAISVARIACIPWFVWLLFGAENRTAAALLLGGLGGRYPETRGTHPMGAQLS